MDEKKIRNLISHIFRQGMPKQAQAAMEELKDVLIREKADDALVRLAENAAVSFSELHALAIAGKEFSREELEAAFFRTRELSGGK